MKVSFRTAVWIAAAVLVVAMMVIAFSPRPVAIDVTEVTRAPMTVTVRDEGRTRVRNVYEVAAPVGGQLLRVEHRPGDHVHAGEPVARVVPSDPAFLDPRALAEARAAVRSAEAALAAAEADAERVEAQVLYARTELSRVENLHERGLTSQEALDRARLEARVAEATLRTAAEAVRMREAEVEQARMRLIQPGRVGREDDTVDIVAPVTGRVLRVAQESATVVTPGMVIMTLGDPRDLEIVAEMLSTDAVEVHPGAEVFIDNWRRDEATLRGRVRLVEPYGFLKISALGVEEQRVNVIIDFADPAEQWASLGHGYRVEAAVVTWQADDVIQAPIAALFRSAGRWAVFRVIDGRAELTPVEVGRDDGRVAEIRSGLEEGDVIVMYPGEQVTDGTRVERRDGSDTIPQTPSRPQ